MRGLAKTNQLRLISIARMNQLGYAPLSEAFVLRHSRTLSDRGCGCSLVC